MVLFYRRNYRDLTHLKSPKLLALSEKNKSGYNDSQLIKWALGRKPAG